MIADLKELVKLLEAKARVVADMLTYCLDSVKMVSDGKMIREDFYSRDDYC